jgi:hypothetical protein
MRSTLPSTALAALLLSIACSTSPNDDGKTFPATVQLYGYDIAPTAERPLSFCMFAIPNCPRPAQLDELCGLTPRPLASTTISVGATDLGFGSYSWTTRGLRSGARQRASHPGDVQSSWPSMERWGASVLRQLDGRSLFQPFACRPPTEHRNMVDSICGGHLSNQRMWLYFFNRPC